MLHETFDVPRGTQRFRELILYICMECQSDHWFGAVKLNKILYHSDFRAFERFGVPLTGVRYFRLPKGPAPKMLVPVRDELVREGALRVEKRQVGPDHRQDRPIALREPVVDLFTADELYLVDEVIRELWSQTAAEVSDASHDIRWRALRHKDHMPYELVHLSGDPLSDAEQTRTQELARELGW
ncbi:Panacea domain-containing protein [Roseivivax jejudonensis]|nr:Panacea domain-containing protein [Roseivivax jejudonensis]